MADVAVDLQSTNAVELTGLGSKAILVHNYSAAVEAYSKAIELLVTEHGDKHESLGDVYLNYGRALLELYREEAEPLGDAAVPKNLDEDDSDDDEAADTADDANNKPESKPEEAKTNGTGESNNVKQAVTVNDDGPSSSSASNTKDKATPMEEGESTEVNSEEGEEEATDLQVAWEVLELAKLIFENQGEKGKMSLADTLILLGEVSLESENFESAINDIMQGVELQKSVLPEDSRTLAQTYYKLGVAHSTNTQIDDAIQNFSKSLEILRKRIKTLNESKDKEKHAGEIKEMEELAPEIEEKIADMKSLKEEAIKKLTSATAAAKIVSPEKQNDSSSNKVNDISHLVKRKRKLEEVIEDKGKQLDAPPIKKPSP